MQRPDDEARPNKNGGVIFQQAMFDDTGVFFRISIQKHDFYAANNMTILASSCLLARFSDLNLGVWPNPSKK